MYSYPVATATSFIGVCRALDLIFVVLVLTTVPIPTICGGISKLICVTGRVVCSAAINYLIRVHRHNKFKMKA